eukprot:TRINITY_DN9151_c0_g5_i4.p1 TRINITY_DN9151_c0_g5~~TRINITY_DN9151_c0_g5_i4.p1  ORF type:complete len:123 (-),score=17.46 TRINITY_DN9151_c0_g5_i4:119-487(-)
MCIRDRSTWVLTFLSSTLQKMNARFSSLVLHLHICDKLNEKEYDCLIESLLLLPSLTKLHLKLTYDTRFTQQNGERLINLLTVCRNLVDVKLDFSHTSLPREFLRKIRSFKAAPHQKFEFIN